MCGQQCWVYGASIKSYVIFYYVLLCVEVSLSLSASWCRNVNIMHQLSELFINTSLLPAIETICLLL